MLFKHCWKASAILLFSLLVVPNVYAQLIENRTDDIAEIVDVKGDEQFQPVGQTTWRKAIVTQDLVGGDHLTTGPFGGLGVAFHDRTQMRLHANSRMVIADSEYGKGRQFNLELGRLWSRASRPEQPITVNTPSATAAIRGTDWFIEILEDGATRLVVFEGDVRFFNEAGEIDVATGASALARPGEAPVLELVATPQDRPRWALSPRADWVNILPISQSDVDANENLTRLFNALLQRELTIASEQLKELNTQTPEEAQLKSQLEIGLAIETTRFADAEALIEQHQTSIPEDETVEVLRSYLDLYAGRYDEARARLSSEMQSRNTGALILLAQTCALQGDDDCFGEATKSLITQAPNDARAHYWRGLYLLMSGGLRADEALTPFKTATELNPRFVSAWATIGMIEAMNGHPHEAVQAYDKALAITPSEPLALSGKAYTYLQIDRIDLAESVLSRVDEKDRNHPDIYSVQSVIALMRGDAENASSTAGKVIAANPDRPGSAVLDSIAHWHAERPGVARKIVANAVRLDPNEPFTALTASVMAQDQFAAGQAVDYARRALNARKRNLSSGLTDLPGSQNGRLDIGSAFRNFGLSSQGEHYTSLAYSIFDPNSAFGQAQVLPDALSRQSATSLGLLLDPLSVTGPNKNAVFYREETRRVTTQASLGTDETGQFSWAGSGEVTGLARPDAHPIAYAASLSVNGNSNGEFDSDSDSALMSLRLGTQRNGRDGIILRTTIDSRRSDLPGSFGIGDRDDRQDNLDIVLGAGYTRTIAWNDRWMVRVTGGKSERRFENPSAFGSTLNGLDYSIAATQSVNVAQDIATRGLFDTAFSIPGEFILVVNPPADLPVTTQLGQSLLPLLDDDDPVRRIDGDADILSIQTRRIKSWGATELSVGAEYSMLAARTDRSEFVLGTTGLGSIIDFDNDNEIIVFETGEPLDVLSRTKTRSEVFQAYVSAKRNMGPWALEAGVFPTHKKRRATFEEFGVTLKLDETTLDPRLGLGWTGESLRARLALQRNRSPQGVDTIAPIGALYLTPNRELGVSSDTIDAATLRIGADLSANTFLDLTLEHQKLSDVSAALPGERLERFPFFIEKADLTRAHAKLETIVHDKLAFAISAESTIAEVDETGPNDGNDLPLIPEFKGGVRGSWIDPRFFRIDASVSYLGERYLDAANQIKLDQAVVTTLSAFKESDDKSWSYGASVSAVASDDNPSSLGRPQSDWSVTATISRRW